jgi:hypothetical protein
MLHTNIQTSHRKQVLSSMIDVMLWIYSEIMSAIRIFLRSSSLCRKHDIIDDY